MPKGAWKEYFAFSKKQRNGAIILLAITAIVTAVTYLYRPVFATPVIDAGLQKQLAYLATKNRYTVVTDSASGTDSSIVKTKPARKTAVAKQPKGLFYFDPNTLDADGWKRLGFKDKTVQNILHYRETGGKFAQPEDIKNVPRIRKKSVDAILPFAKIGASTKQLASLNANLPASTAAPLEEEDKGKTYKTVDINTATAADFKAFPGITDAVANRIVKYRASLNGFTAVDDVAKTYGLPDSTFKKIRSYLSISKPQ